MNLVTAMTGKMIYFKQISVRSINSLVKLEFPGKRSKFSCHTEFYFSLPVTVNLPPTLNSTNAIVFDNVSANKQKFLRCIVFSAPTINPPRKLRSKRHKARQKISQMSSDRNCFRSTPVAKTKSLPSTTGPRKFSSLIRISEQKKGNVLK